MSAAPTRQGPVQFAEVAWGARVHRIEYAQIAPERRGQPLLVFLHEGLGSVTMWKDFPRVLCEAVGCRGLVLSRWGYGQSSPRQGHEKWPVDFMHAQARDFLPAFFKAVGIDTGKDRPWLYGHSDGGSIALIHAASFPDRVAGIVVAAPHIFVEDLTVKSIEMARDGYVGTDLRSKLARYHADPDSAFWGWNDAWLNPDFRRWNIQALLPAIRCPVLAIQGQDDEYGTMAQIDGIALAAPHTQLLKLDDCGHSPHRDQPQQVMLAVGGFMRRHALTISPRNPAQTGALSHP